MQGGSTARTPKKHTACHARGCDFVGTDPKTLASSFSYASVHCRLCRVSLRLFHGGFWAAFLARRYWGSESHRGFSEPNLRSFHRLLHTKTMARWRHARGTFAPAPLG